MERTTIGLTDEAARMDQFGIQQYIDGLAKFIEQCSTPMTIAIQGSWGTGKTSVMEIIRDTLEHKREPRTTHTIWFNTWRYSQFNMGDDLPISLLTHLLNELSGSEEAKKDVERSTRALRLGTKAAKVVGITIVERLVGETVAGKVADTLDQLASQSVDRVSAIEGLQRQFAGCVSAALSSPDSTKDRVVVFIDDLDRLPPAQAVELLEVLKLFLDCKNCVFVLAIDYSVVCRGIEAKYGRLSEDDRENAEIGRRFFDKIIQVPFKLPVAEYNIQNYVRSCLEEVGESGETDVGNYVALIKASIGANPRGIKRLFNAYLLHSIVHEAEHLRRDQNRKLLLFGVLCLQQSFEKAYNYIVERRAELTAEMLDGLISAEEGDPGGSGRDGAPPPQDVLAARELLRLLADMADADHDGSLSAAELDSLRDVLGLSTVTSSGESTAPALAVDEVTALEEMGLTEWMQGRVRELLSAISATIGGVEYAYFTGRHKHIHVKNGKGDILLKIFFIRKTFSIDCLVRPGGHHSPEAADLIEKYRDPRFSSVTIKVDYKSGPDSPDRQALLALARACYEDWKDS